MSNVIIGIHGLSNKPTRAVLEKWWEQAILEGLNKNTAFDVQSINFVSVHWADVMYDDPDPRPDAYEPAQSGALRRYKDSWLDDVRAKASEFTGKVADEVKAFFGIDEVADKILRLKLKDLYEYYHDAKKRTELRGRLRDALMAHTNSRIMLVAHSMGSIVAYDVLRLLGKQNPLITVDHFVTIGSPLGMPHVKYKITEENHLVRTPSIVRKWTNLADRRDPVAIDTHLYDDYEPNDFDVRVTDDLVLNDWPRGPHHKSYGYLRTPEFTDIVKQFI
ncbi:MAG: hypothetical protein GY807_17315 [Gammaproteobacteria bacterium]|nr:hypothetical protein [Gammaproteobacteria bacterium]